ncbi:HlyD family type I secretion periplasmic adaptor subunit [Fulvimarina endophytica]|uniref:Membrane fusion protein (MFP) family protein n=1 Tax=Fulvimarina endophytica TaxID=2293836 RepID=A0A371WZ06_9HYPH|nr:HlyD family type I secretion periplasmic adaptor subunit [Fulvimarina endophytica]RFC62166.1 HlyD family type I secretion periplasmic adaptor subunit [Fulvimarina endophytica]
MKLINRKTPKNEDAESDSAIGYFQSQTAAITEARDPGFARAAVVMFAVMVVAAIALAAILRLERVVVARGMVVSETPTIVVQPLETSVVSSIEVRPGDIVAKGDVLARLDPTITDADVDSLQRRDASLDAEIARLNAEIAGIAYDPDADNEFSQLQTAVFKHRAAEFKASMATYEQKIAATSSDLQRSRNESALLSERNELLGEVVDMRAKLERTSAGSRLNSIQAIDDRLSVERSLAESQGIAITASHQLEALKAERETFEEKWRADTVDQLLAARQTKNEVSEQLAKATYRHSLVALRAVSDAVVLEVAPVSVGSVIQSAREIFRLVPVDAELELEVDINGADQGFVAVGDKVEIKFDAYPFNEHGTAQGVVRNISQDSFTRTEGPRSGEVYYRARVAIDKAELRDVPADFRVIPGMPVTADIVVGDRSILASLTGGLADAFSSALREP